MSKRRSGADEAWADDGGGDAADGVSDDDETGDFPDEVPGVSTPAANDELAAANGVTTAQQNNNAVRKSRRPSRVTLTTTTPLNALSRCACSELGRHKPTPCKLR